jgi:tripartite-type tricarboxylate transporter receptor subunit TctC
VVRLPALLVALGLLLTACGQASAPAAAPTATSAPAAKPTTAAATQPAPAATQPAAQAAAPTTSQPAAKPTQPAAAGANSQAVADFYRGKTLRFIVGYGPGGGYDTYARLLARYLPRYIPGNPTVVVENLPGAGSKLALSQIANALPKDGTVMGFGDGGLAVTSLLTPGDFDFDFAKLNYIGSPSIFEYILFITKAASERSGVKKFDDTLGPNGKQLILGVTSTGLDYITQTLMKEVLGANIKIVPGYAGSAAIRLAMDSGELDGYTNGWDSIHATNDEDIMGGNWLLLNRMTEKPVAGMPEQLQANLPSWLDYAKSDDDKQLLRLGGIQPQVVGRAMFMAPGVPDERVAAVRAALLQVVGDADLKGEADKAKLELNPLSGEQLQESIAQVLAMPDPIKARLKTILKV